MNIIRIFIAVLLSFMIVPFVHAQYYDAETGLNQNGFRDYEPTTGRYIESDPIGLKGGINTYAYVGNNPVNGIDPEGLAGGIITKDTPSGIYQSPGGGISNPFTGPVSRPVTVVDPAGNAIRVNTGQRITTSPNGQYMQVRDPNGVPTGVRIDGPHNPSTHTDPMALQPHAHVPGVFNPNGTNWLPLKQCH